MYIDNYCIVILLYILTLFSWNNSQQHGYLHCRKKSDPVKEVTLQTSINRLRNTTVYPHNCIGQDEDQCPHVGVPPHHRRLHRLLHHDATGGGLEVLYAGTLWYFKTIVKRILTFYNILYIIYIYSFYSSIQR